MYNYQQETDERLVSLYEQGNDHAFDELLARYQSKVYSYILFIVHDEERANDLLQDTFIKVIVRIRSHKYVESGKFGSWLLRIAHNLVIDSFRVDQAAPMVSGDEEGSKVFNDPTLSDNSYEMQRAMEQAQNFSSKYSESISIGMSVRSQLRLLPEAITRFASTNPTTEVVPYFQYYGIADSFLRGEKDILFALYDHVRRYPELKFHRLYTSRVYLITELSDPLAKKELIRVEDLEGRTLMVGGGSPNALKAVQQRVIRNVHVDTINSPDHDNTLTNVAAHKGVCLAPGFLNDHAGQFAWIPFDCEENFPCVLCTHNADNRKEVLDFVGTLQEIYGEQDPNWL